MQIAQLLEERLAVESEKAEEADVAMAMELEQSPTKALSQTLSRTSASFQLPLFPTKLTSE